MHLRKVLSSLVDAVDSIVHLKIAYHDEEGTLITIKINLQEAKRIQRRIHEDILTSASKNYDRFDLDARNQTYPGWRI